MVRASDLQHDNHNAGVAVGRTLIHRNHGADTATIIDPDTTTGGS
ncbi:hypothetical protein [Halospeciosus flavus]|uniref:Uncharacterized protein n=1 Tax=Halospeciosus flavus TaxID=3032283 RepID=A0ABD5Z1L8_9EURY|nr:hypothetical protein [Halospeciosus flavus]